MIKHTLAAGLLTLSSLATFTLAAPAHAQTALVGNVFVDSNPRLIRPSGFYNLGGYGLGQAAYGLGSYGTCGNQYGGAVLSSLYDSCGTSLYGATGLYASPCGLSACNIPVMPFSDCPLLWR